MMWFICTVRPNLAWAPTKYDPSNPPTKGQVVAVPSVGRLIEAKSIVMPVKGADVFIAPSATVLGDVKIGSKSSIWYGAVLRGDVNGIEVGSNTNIQVSTCFHYLTPLKVLDFSSMKQCRWVLICQVTDQ